MKFNEKLIELRKQHGLSQEALGYELNVTRQTISKWELGVSAPEMDKLVELSKYFNISLDTLINDSINLSNTSSTANSSSQTINPEFVGISSEYIPEDVKTKTYVSEPKKRTKISFYLLMGLPIIFMIIIFIFMSSRMFNMQERIFGNNSSDKKLTNKQENLLSQQQQSANNLKEDTMNIINSTPDSTSNSNSTTVSFEVISFNSSLELTQKTPNAFLIKNMINSILNKPDKVKEIVVVYNNIEASSEKELLDLQEDFANASDSINNNYVISFEYADEGYINKVIIKDK